MPRLSYPTASDLLARSDDEDRLDSFSTYHRHEGVLTVNLTDQGTVLTAARSADGGAWLVTATGGANGDLISLSEPIVQRVNRLLSDEDHDGDVIERDWRRSVHTLRARSRHSLPLTSSTDLILTHTGHGWDVAPATRVQRADLREGRPVAGTIPAPTAAPAGATAGHPLPLAPAPSAPIAPGMAPLPPAPLPVVVAPVAPPAPGESMVVLHPTLVPVIRSKAYEGRAVFPAVVKQRWDMALAAHEAGYPATVMFVGPTGAAKGHVALDLVEDANCDLIKFSMASMKEPSEFFGNVDAVDGTVRFTYSTALEALTAPLSAPERGRKLLLDEATRASGEAMNALLEIMDGSGFLTVPQLGKQVRLNPAVQIVLTANIGSDFLYTQPLDPAVWTRVASWIRLEYLNEADEKAMLLSRVPGLSDWHAGAIAAAAAGIRESAKTGLHAAISHRQTLSVAQQIANGASKPGMARAAAEAVLLDAFSPQGEGNSEQAKVRTHIAGVQWDEPKEGEPTPEPTV